MSDRVDPYCYSGTNVLIDKGGFRLQPELDRFEADAILLAAASLTFYPITGQFDQARLLETHRRLFHYVYAWAGQLRQNSGRMAKLRESGRVISYGPSEHVPAALAAVFAKLNEDRYLCELSAIDLAEKLALYYSEIDAIHPFREGNSRTLRVFISDLCNARNYRLDWTPFAVSPQQREQLYFARDLAVIRGDRSELTRIIQQNLRPNP